MEASLGTPPSRYANVGSLRIEASTKVNNWRNREFKGFCRESLSSGFNLELGCCYDKLGSSAVADI